MAVQVGLDKVKELAIRSQGRDPEWKSQEAYTGTPLTLTSGVDVSSAIVSMLMCALRKEAHVHTSRITITTADLTLSTYTVTIDAVAVAYDASVELPSNAVDLLAGIANAINADAGAAAIVSAVTEDLDGDGVIDTITLRNVTGESNAHLTEVAVAGGTGAMALKEDAVTAKLRVWFLPDTSNDNALSLPWALINGADYTIDRRGFVERFETAGASRMFIEAYDVLGPGSAVPAPELTIAIGPGGVES